MACGAPDDDGRESASQGTRRRKHARLDERLASIEDSIKQLIQMQSSLSGKVELLEGVGRKITIKSQKVDDSVKECQYTIETRMNRIEGLLFASDFTTFHKIDQSIAAASAFPAPIFETPPSSGEVWEFPFVPTFPCRGWELTSQEPADGMHDEGGMHDKGDMKDASSMRDNNDMDDKGSTNDRNDKVNKNVMDDKRGMNENGGMDGESNMNDESGVDVQSNRNDEGDEKEEKVVKEIAGENKLVEKIEEEGGDVKLEQKEEMQGSEGDEELPAWAEMLMTA